MKQLSATSLRTGQSRRLAVALQCAATLSFFMMALGSPALASLKVGDPAPDFTLKGSDGQTTTLSAQIGEKNVVLAFFPKAFTGG